MNPIGSQVNAGLCLQVPVRLCPSAASGVAKAYPSGPPVLVPARRSPTEVSRCADAEYLIRQPFIVELPVSLRANARALPPRVFARRCPRLAQAHPRRSERNVPD